MARIKEDVDLVSPDRKSLHLHAGDEIPDWASVPAELILGPDDPEPVSRTSVYQQRRRSW